MSFESTDGDVRRATEMDRRRKVCKELWDSPTTLISHTWRGSVLTDRKAGREEGKVEA